MGRGAGWLTGAILLIAAGTNVRAATLDAEGLQAEMRENRALAAYVKRNGTPDAAETHVLADRPPWDDHEVTLYYLARRLEIGFARAFILGRPEVQITRYERPMTDRQVAAISARPRLASVPTTSTAGLDPAERAEAAARRAEDAADRVEAAVAPVERAADKAEAMSARMAKSAVGKTSRK